MIKNLVILVNSCEVNVQTELNQRCTLAAVGVPEHQFIYKSARLATMEMFRADRHYCVLSVNKNAILPPPPHSYAKFEILDCPWSFCWMQRRFWRPQSQNNKSGYFTFLGQDITTMGYPIVVTSSSYGIYHVWHFY